MSLVGLDHYNTLLRRKLKQTADFGSVRKVCLTNPNSQPSLKISLILSPLISKGFTI